MVGFVSLSASTCNISIHQSKTTETVTLIAAYGPVSYPRNKASSIQQGKSEGFDSCDRPSNLTQTGFKSSIFQPVWPWNLMDDPKKQ